MSSEKRMTTPDIMKGILIIMVVIRHVLTCTIGDSGGIIGNYIWAVQMPGFFVLAGFFGVNEVPSLKCLLTRIKNAVLTLGIPFFSWSIIVCTLIFGMNGRNVLWALKDLLYNVDHGLWFLWVLLIIRIFFCTENYILYITKRYGIFISLFMYIVFGCAMAFIGFKMSIGFIGIKYILYYSIFYCIGFSIKLFSNQICVLYKRTRKVLFAISILALTYIVINIDLYSLEDNLLGISIRGGAALLSVFSLYEICVLFEERLLRLKLDKFGKYSLEIYASHAMIIICLGLSGIDKVSSIWEKGGFARFTQLFIIITGATYLIVEVLKSNKYLNRLFFGKGWN